MNDVAKKPAGMGIASMVCGILSLVLWWVPFLGLILGVLGCIFGGNGIRLANLGEAGGKGMSIAGLVTGVIGTVLGLYYVLVVAAISSI
tara:strand:- start:144 stop:410 length:267 start_codon:yes stop_codon:yes gene_type:complete